MDNRAGEMMVFVRVVEAGSFSEAARSLLMTPSTVSKLVQRIELRLGVRLLERSTRKLSLTDEGRLYYERCSRLLSDLDEIEVSLTRDVRTAHGTIRVNASVAFGTFGIEPLLQEFWEQHPNIVVNLSLSDEIIDLYLDRTDIAFRVGKLADSSLTARLIGTARRRMVASSAYLGKRGTPETIEDLDYHNCLGFNFRRAQPVWPLNQGGRIVDRMVQGNLLANNGETVRRLAVAGAGIARLADFHIDPDVAAGRLVEVLNDTGHDTEEVHAVFLGGPNIPQRIRLFLDFMVPRLQAFMGRR
ncbi:LysR family transcriptional regulator [Rhizobium sullae]|uniref:HTH-type transcriptional regulator TtuA n=1 Tax=Rhizobium sullae TaxID=50338 RepID=A0A2N0D1K8_RHISU|nr:LysR family transcriptional regulator [Rhizobium sullae]PKA39994.1 LysR family transcriptional regulator [Rhizobium sullae]